MARIQALRSAGGNRLLLVIALAAGLVAAVLVIVALNDSGDGGSSTGTTADAQQVLVANRDISPGTEITADMVELREVPADLVLPGSFTETDALVGETAKVAIVQGEQVVSGRLGLPVPDDGLSGVVPGGMRGIALEVKEVTAVGGLLLPGDRVDVYVTHKITGLPGLTEDQFILRSFLAFQDIEVASVAQEAQEPTAHSSDDQTEEQSATSGEVSDDVENQPGAQTVTLLLTPDQAQQLAHYQDPEFDAKIFTSLRAFGDHAIIENPQPFDTVMSKQDGFGDLLQ
jgi:pilus assembly protein CpaB